MTKEQKSQIEKLRNNGYGYKSVSQMMNIPLNAVKSYCRRNNLTGVAVRADNTTLPHFCAYCGQEVAQTKGHREKKFCSSKCRALWWKNHKPAVEKSMTEHICKCCGKTFYDYEKYERKYCSHECYISSRFKGGERCE